MECAQFWYLARRLDVHMSARMDSGAQPCLGLLVHLLAALLGDFPVRFIVAGACCVYTCVPYCTVHMCCVGHVAARGRPVAPCACLLVAQAPHSAQSVAQNRGNRSERVGSSAAFGVSLVCLVSRLTPTKTMCVCVCDAVGFRCRFGGKRTLRALFTLAPLAAPMRKRDGVRDRLCGKATRLRVLRRWRACPPATSCRVSCGSKSGRAFEL